MGAFTDYVRHFDFVEVPIVNPGSLSLGEYGTMKLVHNVEGEHSHWYVSETTKKYIPSFTYHDDVAEGDEMGEEDDFSDELAAFVENNYANDEEQELNQGKDLIKGKTIKKQVGGSADGSTPGKVKHFTHGVNPHVMSSLLNKSINQ